MATKAYLLKILNFLGLKKDNIYKCLSDCVDKRVWVKVDKKYVLVYDRRNRIRKKFNVFQPLGFNFGMRKSTYKKLKNGI